MKAYNFLEINYIVYYEDSEYYIDRIKEIEFDINDAFNNILRQGMNCNYNTTDSNMYWMTYEYSTGLEFIDGLFPGHIISLEEDWSGGKTVLKLFIKDPIYDQETGEKLSLDTVIKEGLFHLERFIRDL